VQGTLKGNGCVEGSRITVASLEITYGTAVAISPAASAHNADRFDPTHSSESWREHIQGLNYEGECPTNAGRRVILHRGYGTFDWSVDAVGLVCVCCLKVVDPRSISRVAVNHCEWAWEGITDRGEKCQKNGASQDLNEWVLEDVHTWRKLIITTSNPFIQTQLVTCALCKQAHPYGTIKVISNRQLCMLCYTRVNQALEERRRNQGEVSREYEVPKYEVPRENEVPREYEVQHIGGGSVRKGEKGEFEARVRLPGLGEHVELRRVNKGTHYDF